MAAGTLKHQGSQRNLPALVYLPNQVLSGHAYVFEEYLVEAVRLRHLHQGPHGNAGCLHVNEEVADALVLGSDRVGSNQHENPIRMMCGGSPYLGAIDNEIVALFNSAGLQSCQVGSGIGFRIALAPNLLGG